MSKPDDCDGAIDELVSEMLGMMHDIFGHDAMITIVVRHEGDDEITLMSSDNDLNAVVRSMSTLKAGGTAH